MPQRNLLQHVAFDVLKKRGLMIVANSVHVDTWGHPKACDRNFYVVGSFNSSVTSNNTEAASGAQSGNPHTISRGILNGDLVGMASIVNKLQCARCRELQTHVVGYCVKGRDHRCTSQVTMGVRVYARVVRCWVRDTGIARAGVAAEVEISVQCRWGINNNACGACTPRDLRCHSSAVLRMSGLFITCRTFVVSV